VAYGSRNLRYTWLKGFKRMIYYYNFHRGWDSVWYDPMPPGRA